MWTGHGGGGNRRSMFCPNCAEPQFHLGFYGHLTPEFRMHLHRLLAFSHAVKYILTTFTTSTDGEIQPKKTVYSVDHINTGKVVENCRASRSLRDIGKIVPVLSFKYLSVLVMPGTKYCATRRF